MSDVRYSTRDIEISLPDESTIQLSLHISMSTDASGSIANDRLRSNALTKTLGTVEYMLITVLEFSNEEMQEMISKHGN
jgi:hypothetical protein